MTDAANGAKTPIWFWIVAVLATLWNGFGVVDFVMTQTRNEAYLAGFTAEQLAFFTGFPMWFTLVWAVAVFAAFFGSLFLLLRKSWAVPVLAASLVFYAISLVYNFGFSGAMDIMGMTGTIISLVIGLILVGLFFLARWAKARGILT